MDAFDVGIIDIHKIKLPPDLLHISTKCSRNLSSDELSSLAILSGSIPWKALLAKKEPIDFDHLGFGQ